MTAGNDAGKKRMESRGLLQMIEKQGSAIKGRRHARETALQALYQMELSGAIGEPPADDKIRQAGSSATADYSKILLSGVIGKRGELDRLIEASSERWEVDRMPVVDRCILRMAAYELIFRDDVPYKVAIDEAVSLACKFGGDESGAFVNGILDSLARTRRKDYEAPK